MKVGPSEPPCRRRLQTAISCCGSKGRGGERYGRWCGSNGSADGQGFASFANGASVRTSRRRLRGVRTVPGGSRNRPRWPSLCRMLTLPSSGFRLWSCGLSTIRRTAGCGPACPVVWQGRRGDPSPYADCVPSMFDSSRVKVPLTT